MMRTLCSILIVLVAAWPAFGQQPINADQITRGTLPASRIGNGVISTNKLGGDITTFAKTFLQGVDAAAGRSALGLGSMAVEVTSTYVTQTSATTALGGKLSNRETGANTLLALGAIDDGAFMRRSGTNLIGDSAGVVSAFKLATRSGSEPNRPVASGNAGRAIRLVNLGTGTGYARSVWQESDGSTWGALNGHYTFYRGGLASAITLAATSTDTAIGPAITVPGGLLGPNSQLVIRPHIRANVNAATNQVAVLLGGQEIYRSAAAAWYDHGAYIRVTNANATNAQTRFGIGTTGTGFGNNNTSDYVSALALDTTASVNITFVVEGTSGNTMQFMGVTVEVFEP